MKKLMVALAVTAGAMGMSTTDADARWICGARSATGGWGVGWAPGVNRARRIALRNCAVNTPRGYVCYIRSCRRY